MKYKKNKDPFKPMHKAAIGIAGLGLTTAAIGGTEFVGVYGTSQAMNTISSFAPVVTTAYIGKSLLPKTKYKY